MPGLNNFRGGAAAPTTPAPTTYTGSYATTAQDARDKCQGNVVASITRTRTSQVSLFEAIRLATLDAKAALVCPVFNATYQTTPEDYTTKCGAGTSGASVTGYGSSGKDQDTANAAAKQDAISKITCPVPLPSFAQVLSPGDNVQTLTFDASSRGKVHYNNPVQSEATAPGAGAMSCFYPDFNTQVGYLNYDPADAGHPMAYELDGVTYYKNAATGNGLTFTDGSVLLGN